MSLASNVASVLLITGSHHYTFYILYLVHFVQREIILDFTAKITHSEKAIHFLSFMSCSINTLKSYMFFTCKNFMFSDFMRKKNIAPGNGGVRGLCENKRLYTEHKFH